MMEWPKDVFLLGQGQIQETTGTECNATTPIITEHTSAFSAQTHNPQTSEWKFGTKFSESFT